MIARAARRRISSSAAHRSSMSSLLNAFCLRGLLSVMTAIRFAIVVSTMAGAVRIAVPPLFDSCGQMDFHLSGRKDVRERPPREPRPVRGDRGRWGTQLGVCLPYDTFSRHGLL